jgi:hypothetical protein
VREFLKAGGDRIAVRDVGVRLGGAYFLSQRGIRKFRQAFNAWLEEHFVLLPPPVRGEPGKEKENTSVHTVAVKNAAQLPPDMQCDRTAVCEDPGPGQEYVLPAFCREGDLPQLREKIRDAAAKGVRHFRLTSLYQFALFGEKEGLRFSTSFPLPVTNHAALDLLKDLGAHKVQLWPELEKTVITSLAGMRSATAEIYRYGRLPLLQTRAELPREGYINDARGAGFYIQKEKELTVLYPEAVFSLNNADIPPASTYTDLFHAAADDKKTSRFNYDRELV